jgi:hypothetical protein
LSGQVDLTGSDGEGQQISLTTLKAGDVLGETRCCATRQAPTRRLSDEDLTALFD